MVNHERELEKGGTPPRGITKQNHALVCLKYEMDGCEKITRCYIIFCSDF